jgi:hypothetical protein
MLSMRLQPPATIMLTLLVGLQVWGVNNREAALRLIPDTGGRANCELKVGRS